MSYVSALRSRVESRFYCKIKAAANFRTSWIRRTSFYTLTLPRNKIEISIGTAAQAWDVFC
jgi:hypothetical protein